MKWILAYYLYNDILIMQCNYCVCENRDMHSDMLQYIVCCKLILKFDIHITLSEVPLTLH